MLADQDQQNRQQREKKSGFRSVSHNNLIHSSAEYGNRAATGEKHLSLIQAAGFSLLAIVCESR